MEKLIQRLSRYASIGLDTSVFIYHFEAHPVYHKHTSGLLAEMERGRWQAATSVITLMEINVRPLMLGREDVARQYEALLVNFPHLQIVELNREIARHATVLRAKFRIRPADALQVAACLDVGCQAFVTNDLDLGRLSSLVDVVVLDDFLYKD